MPKLKKDEEFKVLNDAVKKLRALDHPLRQKIVSYLREGSSNVSNLFRKLKIEQSVASQHLSILRNAGLVNAEKEGKLRIYSANEGNIQALKDNAAKI